MNSSTKQEADSLEWRLPAYAIGSYDVLLLLQGFLPQEVQAPCSVAVSCSRQMTVQFSQECKKKKKNLQATEAFLLIYKWQVLFIQAEELTFSCA